MKYFLDKPEHIKISLTNVCNYRCVMCYNSTLKQKRGFIEDGLLFKILDECKKTNIRKVSLGSTGEALTHKKFINYLTYAKSLGLWVSTSTNGSLLTPKIANAFIREKIDRVNLSIYSSNSKEHSQYTGTKLFTQTVKNIKYFLKLRNKTKSKVKIFMSFLELPGINDFFRFIQYWRTFTESSGLEPLDISVRSFQNWGGLDIRDSSLRRLLLSKTNFDISKSVQVIRCPHIRFYLHIDHEGNVYPCCNIPEARYDSNVKFGNIYKDNIMDVWHSKRYLAFKRAHYRKNISQYLPCTKCSDIKPYYRKYISAIIK